MQVEHYPCNPPFQKFAIGITRKSEKKKQYKEDPEKRIKELKQTNLKWMKKVTTELRKM